MKTAIETVMDDLEENKMDKDKYIQILADHYQKTFEVSYELWKQRNKLYFLLLGVVGAGVLLTFQTPQANSLLVDWIANLIGVRTAARIAEIRNEFPFAILHGIIGLAIFYILVILYQHTRLINHDYAYLADLESELRKEFPLGEKSMFFTRESTYARGRSYRSGRLIALTYVISLGLLLLAFFGGRLAEDIRSDNLLLVIVDAALSILVLAYFVLYVKESL